MFVAGSVVCGFSPTIEVLIGARVMQGIGIGGLMALTQVVLASTVAPRERGRYAGHLGGVMAVATVGGPLLGGLLVDSPLGWRWCFLISVPPALLATILLRRVPPLPRTRREVHIDYLGAALLAAGVCAVLIWTSLAGATLPWASPASLGLLGGGVALLALALWVESRAREPIIPLALFRRRGVALTAAASLGIGVSMFSATVFLAQYFQLGRGAGAAQAGLLTAPLVLALFLGSTWSGRLVSRSGRYRGLLLFGAGTLSAGLVLLGVLLPTGTSYWPLAVGMAMVGAGVGITQQNLILVVQNTVAMRDIGAASSAVAFLRSLGGAAGVAVLGAVLQNSLSADLTTAGTPEATSGPVVEAAYGAGIAEVFWWSAPLATAAVVAIWFLREEPLRTTVDAPATAGPGG